MTSSISASDKSRFSRAALKAGARRNLSVMALFAVLTLAAYIGLVFFQLGSWSKAEWWLRDIINLRRIFYTEELANFPPDQQKTLIIGGSASLFGVNSRQIQTEIGEPVLNLGLHAGLDIDLLMSAANEYVDTNDRVVVPLEFELYNRESPTDLTPANFLAFFYAYMKPVPLSHYPEILIAVSPVQILEAAWEKIEAGLRGKRRHPLLDDPALLADWQKVRAEPGLKGYGPYDYSTMTDHGDKELILNTPPRLLKTLAPLNTPIVANLSPYGIRQLTTWRDIIAGEGASMFLTWPVILEDDSGSIFNESYWNRLIKLAKASSEQGLPIYCDPVAAVVPRQYRYDTVYHLNAKGSAIYSDGLAACIRDIEKHPFDFASADPKDLARRAREKVEGLRIPAEPLVFPYERNLVRLHRLQAAIDQIHAEGGAYPSTLPPGPNAASLWYKSDGKDYKLLAEDADECYVVEMVAPDRVDPVRRKDESCGAYGYWSAGAADW
ncbi:hypothetical protein C3941_12160 [Kaistia algarum]|uniref:hypothetical protein n=1 Tax=Kaistia algarum TaxID=2083279 RepID=UPI000CE7978C|nr:hypothetical protein [Kaistia algarum]MCX5515101.1 hypothetical protein [Kaistia algarum]PPE79829.1 hypothetical protein C3941_12160 [Kaistia algarum]